MVVSMVVGWVCVRCLLLPDRSVKPVAVSNLHQDTRWGFRATLELELDDEEDELDELEDELDEDDEWLELDEDEEWLEDEDEE
jgi:hypothetical protein